MMNHGAQLYGTIVATDGRRSAVEAPAPDVRPVDGRCTAGFAVPCHAGAGRAPDPADYGVLHP